MRAEAARSLSLPRVAITPVWGLTLGLALLLVVRLPLLDNYMAYSGDMASYLMTRNWVLGTDPTNHMEAHFRPPIIGAVLLPFTVAFGDLMGSKILSLLSSVAVAYGFYAFARIWLRPWFAVVAAWALTLTPMVADYTVGGYLPLLSLAVMLVALRLFHDALHRKTWVWLPAVPVFVLVGLNQTAPPIFTLAALLMIAETTREWRRGLLAGGIAVLVSLAWYYPFYAVNIPFNPQPMISPNMPALTVRGEAGPWLYVLIATALLMVAPINRWRVLPLGVFAVISLAASRDIALNNVMSRTTQMVVVYAVLAGGVAVQYWGDKLHPSWTKRLPSLNVAGLAIWALVLSSFMWTHLFTFYADRSNTLTPDRLAVIEWMGTHTAQDAKVMAHPRGLGYYTGALAPREWDAPFAVSLVGREAYHAAYRCALGWEEGCDAYALRDIYGFDYLAVDESAWERIQDTPADGWQRTASAPWLRLAYESGPVKVYGWQ